MADTKTLQKLCVGGMKLEFQKCWEQLGISKLYMMALLSRDEYTPILDARPTSDTLYYTDPASGNAAVFHPGQFVLWPEDKSEFDSRGFGIVVDVTNDKDGNPCNVLWYYVEEAWRELKRHEEGLMNLVSNMDATNASVSKLASMAFGACRLVVINTNISSPDRNLLTLEAKTCRRELKEHPEYYPVGVAVSIPGQLPLLVPMGEHAYQELQMYQGDVEETVVEDIYTYGSLDLNRVLAANQAVFDRGMTDGGQADVEAVAFCRWYNMLEGQPVDNVQTTRWYLPSIAELRAIMPYVPVIDEIFKYVLGYTFQRCLHDIAFWTIDSVVSDAGYTVPMAYDIIQDKVYQTYQREAELTVMPMARLELFDTNRPQI